MRHGAQPADGAGKLNHGVAKIIALRRPRQWNADGLGKKMQIRKQQTCTIHKRRPRSGYWLGCVDLRRVKKVIDTFVSLGIDAADTDKECLDVYKDQFEVPVLTATEAYYAAEASAFIKAGSTEGSGNIPKYLKKVEARLHEEEERVVRYLHATTREELVGPCENVLLHAHAPRIWEAFQTLLELDADEDLQRIYTLLARAHP
ncbi:Cullin repeat-like-containing domain protein [Mycena capillaripes]|nr:Cullin repeat-like-containing domain protein [Mycena capillaripes]